MTQEQEKLNLDEKVQIKNLCAWDLYFKRLESNGDVKIPSKGVVRLTRAEIQAQSLGGNVMFNGTDGIGSNARIYIDDKPTRILLDFEQEDSKEEQKILTPDKVKQILEYKTFATFQKHIEESVVTQAEKLILVEEAKKLKLNDYEKINFIQEYTGYKFEQPKNKQTKQVK